jgi:hypothetical protein
VTPMVSPSSRRKNGIGVSSGAVLQVLQDGMVIGKPSADVLRAMDVLAGRGIVGVHRHEYVLCANSRDRDFPPAVRDCRGRVFLRDGADEGGYEYRCPDCNRPVFPNRNGKQWFYEYRVTVIREGVVSYLASLLSTLGLNDRLRCEGVWEVDTDEGRVTLCVVEYCAEERVLAREWAAMSPTLYVTVGPKERDWLLGEAWLKHLRLADIVSGEADLVSALTDAAATGRPASFHVASVPIYTKGARPIHFEPVETIHTDRAFAVAVGPSAVVVNGVEVMSRRAGTRMVVFRILWKRFLDNLKNGHEPDDFPPMTIQDIADLVQKETKKEVEDVESVRRAVNRMQADIEKAVKKHTGAPIGSGDIIQTIPSQGTGGEDHGYRINPVSVMPRLFLAVSADLSEEK